MSMESFDKFKQSFDFQRQMVLQNKAVEPKDCEHEYKKFTQTIVPERTDTQIQKGMEYQQGNAYFIVRGCPKCKDKEIVDMKVEK